ncbi:hypothetical protein FEM33_10205 [Dyadobacter flavalbus]|uniref:DUF5640 domain-containing protein n=1 Tax=Dyadobacter flavalbus TaxID=2579942 RepID=A0A5M8QY20_9BACT|nr:hypothetical protein [Dyadobacter flavalbus]KAA6439930.1 hypothetical protein FEM33_10205 [Dyadobacter flavalbus]
MKQILIILLGLFIISCSGNSEGDSVKDKYLGEWDKMKGKASTLTIYEENNGLFLKYSKGDKYPLKFEKEGNYYSAVTGFGATPILIENNVLEINGTKYQKR